MHVIYKHTAGGPFWIMSVTEAGETVKRITGNGWNNQLYVCVEGCGLIGELCV